MNNSLHSQTRLVRCGLLVLLALLLVCSASHARAQGAAGKPTYNKAAFKRVFSERTAAVRGAKLHYMIGGQGEPIILLHGFPESWYEWRFLMPALAKKYTVVALDLPGTGGSQPASGYDTRAVAVQVHALARQLGFKRVNLITHDLGGLVGYAYACAYPKETARLVFLDAPLPGVFNWDQIVSSPYTWHFGFHNQRGLTEALVSGRERRYVGYFMPRLSYNPASITSGDIAYYAKSVQRETMHGFFEYYRAFETDAAQNKKYAKTKLTLPVLALGGDISVGSFIVPLMQTVADNVQGGPIAHCGHWMPEEQPHELQRRILDFLHSSSGNTSRVGQSRSSH